MKIIKLLCLLLMFIAQITNSQQISEPKTAIIDGFMGTIIIPANFEAINEAEWNKVRKNGEDTLEKTVGQDVIDEATTIFIYRNGRFNTIEANWQPFDVEKDGAYLETYTKVNKLMYKTFETQMPGAKLDSVSSKQKIGGLDFQRFDLHVDLPNGFKMTTIGVSRLFEKKEFTINITFVDKVIGKKMIAAVLNAKFKE